MAGASGCGAWTDDIHAFIELALMEERARIARELHDVMAQGLTGILMHLQAAQRDADEDLKATRVQEAIALARVTLVDARRSVHALRPISSRRASLVLALKSVLTTAFAGSPVSTSVLGDDLGIDLPEPVENELLRIAQEAATNTLKHGRATRFEAKLACGEGYVEFRLADDGVGFDPKRSQDGFGLTGMRERAIRVGAALSVETGTGRGTCIAIRVRTGKDRSVPRADGVSRVA